MESVTTNSYLDLDGLALDMRFSVQSLEVDQISEHLLMRTLRKQMAFPMDRESVRRCLRKVMQGFSVVPRSLLNSFCGGVT